MDNISSAKRFAYYLHFVKEQLLRCMCNKKTFGMLDKKVINVTVEKEIWEKISSDFQQNPDLLQYSSIIIYDNTSILLDIDIDPGGGFESGFETTTFMSKLPANYPFRFAIHHQTFIDEIGKFLGMQDVRVGIEEFDKKFIVKTNDEQKVRNIFTDADISNILLSLGDCTLGITSHSTGEEEKIPFLEYQTERGLFDVLELQKIYSVFYRVLKKL